MWTDVHSGTSSFKEQWLGMFLFQNLICSECGDEFTLHSQLAIHMEEHRQELANNRVHTCKACKMEFETTPELKEHMKAHCKARYGHSQTSTVKTLWDPENWPTWL